MALVTAPPTEEQHEDLSEIGRLAQPTEIYSALSNRDSFDIFCLAFSGIRATTEILREYGFSKKRYYVRLKQLIDVGLVQKQGRFYRHIDLGKMFYESQVRVLQRQFPPSNSANYCSHVFEQNFQRN